MAHNWEYWDHQVEFLQFGYFRSGPEQSTYGCYFHSSLVSDESYILGLSRKIVSKIRFFSSFFLITPIKTYFLLFLDQFSIIKSDDMICKLQNILVMLDHQDRISLIQKSFQDFQ